MSACSQAMCSVYIASNILALEAHLAVREGISCAKSKICSGTLNFALEFSLSNVPHTFISNRGHACDVPGRQFLHISAYFCIRTAILRGNE